MNTCLIGGYVGAGRGRGGRRPPAAAAATAPGAVIVWAVTVCTTVVVPPPPPPPPPPVPPPLLPPPPWSAARPTRGRRPRVHRRRSPARRGWPARSLPSRRPRRRRASTSRPARPLGAAARPERRRPGSRSRRRGRPRRSGDGGAGLREQISAQRQAARSAPDAVALLGRERSPALGTAGHGPRYSGDGESGLGHDRGHCARARGASCDQGVEPTGRGDLRVGNTRRRTAPILRAAMVPPCQPMRLNADEPRGNEPPTAVFPAPAPVPVSSPEAHGVAPTLAASDQCANCGAPLAADQHYCLACGERRGPARFSSLPAAPGGATATWRRSARAAAPALLQRRDAHRRRGHPAHRDGDRRVYRRAGQERHQWQWPGPGRHRQRRRRRPRRRRPARPRRPRSGGSGGTHTKKKGGGSHKNSGGGAKVVTDGQESAPSDGHGRREGQRQGLPERPLHRTFLRSLIPWRRIPFGKPSRPPSEPASAYHPPAGRSAPLPPRGGGLRRTRSISRSGASS